MDLRDAIYGRRAMREYTSDPGDDGLLRQSYIDYPALTPAKHGAT
jgi:hypothetical protein